MSTPPEDPSPDKKPPVKKRGRPFSLTVAGQRIKVEWAQIESYGMYLHDERKIVMSEGLLTDAQAFTDTLRHEMLHATFALSGLSFGWTDEQEEQVVRCLDGIFFPAWDKVLAQVRRQMNSAV